MSSCPELDAIEALGIKHREHLLKLIKTRDPRVIDAMFKMAVCAQVFLDSRDTGNEWQEEASIFALRIAAHELSL